MFYYQNMTMSFERSYENLNKRIPLHYQKRYLANKSNGSFNAAYITGIFKNKIKTLLKVNKTLAVELQRDRAKKEELLRESKDNGDLILYSRLNLSSMSANLKTVVTVLDDTLALLELHSTAGLSKFTPKNTYSREYFKKQIKSALMEEIPEESKQSLSKDLEDTLTNDEDIQIPTTQSHALFTNENQQGENISETRKPNTKSLNKEINGSELNNSSFEVKHTSSRINKKKVGNKVASSNKNQAVSKKQKSTKKFTKVTTPNETKQSSTVIKGEEEVKGCELLPKQLGKKKSKILQDIKVIDSSSCNPMKTRGKVTLDSNLVKHSMNDLNGSELFSNVDPDINKENVNFRNPITTKESFELSPESILASGRKLSLKGSALKNFSSNINIENLSLDRKKVQKSDSSLDTLTNKDVISQTNGPKYKAKRKFVPNLNTNNKKSLFAHKKITEDILTETFTNKDTSSSQFQKILLQDPFQPQEIVKNLAKNTVLTTAEIHKIPERENSVKHIPQNFDKCLQPIVLIPDIFKVNKTFCKSITNSSQSEPNIPLEMQLLQHCSSLKIIPEESETSNDSKSDASKSIEPDLKKDLKSKKKFAEPSLSVEGEIKDDILNSQQRAFRKRSTATYKEPTLKLKMRR